MGARKPLLGVVDLIEPQRTLYCFYTPLQNDNTTRPPLPEYSQHQVDRGAEVPVFRALEKHRAV